MTTTTTSKRTPKAVHFAEIVKVLEAANRPELVAVMEHEIELLANKNKTKSGEKRMTATQKENAGIKAEIYEAMELGVKYTCADIAKLVPSLNDASTSRVSALLRQMRDDVEGASGQVHRTCEKGKTYFEKVGE